MTTRAPALWLLRHAQPLIAPGVCYGQLDVPAEPSATLQASLRFGSVMPKHTAIRYSPLQRCEQLAQSLQALETNLTADQRLQEMDFGSWEGKPWNDIGRSAVDAWSQDLYGIAPGGGESLAAMLQRVRSALLDSWQHDSRLGTRDVVWVTHAGVIRCVQWLLRYGAAHPTSADWKLPAPAFGQGMTLPWGEHHAALNALQAA
jgi:alpha-ribazole phosphatase